MKKSASCIVGFLGVLSICYAVLSTLFAPIGFTSLSFVALGNQQQAAQAASNCASPPSGFNATTATAAQLNQYGLPPRPNSASTGYKTWQKLVSYAKNRLCNSTVHTSASQSTVAPNTTNMTTAQSKASRSASSITNSGYWLVAPTAASFTAVYGELTLPCASRPMASNVTAGSQVGIYTNGYSIGITDTSDHTMYWSMSYNGTINYVTNPSNFSCGDHIVLEAEYAPLFKSGFLIAEDTTAQKYFSINSRTFVPRGTTVASWGEQRFVSSGVPSTPLSLYDFGTVSWNALEYSTDAAASTLTPANNNFEVAVSMVNTPNSPRYILAEPDPLLSTGRDINGNPSAQFIDRWKASA